MTLIAYLFLRLRPAKIVIRYMCKKSPFRLPVQKEHGKLPSTLFKFERKHLHPIYWSTGRELSCKKSLLGILESLRLFVNTMGALDKSSPPNRNNLMERIQMQFSQKLKTFSWFLMYFRNLGHNLNIFKKRMTLIAYLLLRLRPPNNGVRYMCKKSRFRLPFQKEHGKRVSTLFKFERQHLFHVYWSTGRQFNWKNALLVIYKSLRLFVNTMSAVGKCSLPNRDNLMEAIHMQLFQNLKTFSRFFSAFWKSRLNFEYFQKKDDPPSLFISEATAWEKRR